MDDQSASAKTFDAYRIIRPEIARGGMGVVHEAMSPDGKRVAIKVLNRAKIENREQGTGNREQGTGIKGRVYEKYVSLFKEEYQTLAGLKHPNIARVHKIGFFEDQLYIAQEFIEGKPLAEYVRGWKPADMIPLFVQVLEGLDFIHRSGLVHLDIKSENILVTTSGAGRRAQGLGPKDLNKRTSLTPNALSPTPEVKIIDFGLAVAPSEYAGSFRGSVSTMAPEVALGKKEDVDARADLFSFACVMYQCITCGDMPFARSRVMAREAICRTIERERLPRPPSESHREHPERICEFLDKIVLHLLAKDPKDRFYGNARAVINALATKSPEVFAGTPDTRSAYLVPMGNAHIGRGKEQERIFGFVSRFLDGSGFQPPVIVIEGGVGLGKSHLLQKIAEMFLTDIERISLHRLTFPASAASCAQFIAGIETALPEKRPLVMLLDDVHESVGDTEGHRKASEFITRIMRLAREKNDRPVLYESSNPVFACIAFNNINIKLEQTIERMGLRLSFVERIVLGPLSFPDIHTYLKSTPAFKGKQIPDEWVDCIYSRTGGNPLLIRDHLEYVDSGNMLFNLEGEVIVNPAIEREANLPPYGIKTRFEEILERCDTGERRILELISVWNWQKIAPPIRYEDIFDLLPLAFLKLKLDNLVCREILTSDIEGKAYKFRNEDYFPALIYEHMVDGERRFWHGKISSHLKKMGGEGETVMLHDSFGEPCRATYKAILNLGRKFLVQKGNIRAARNLFEHGMTLAEKGNHKLFACFTSSMMDAYRQEGKFRQAEAVCGKAIDALSNKNGCDGWKSLLLAKLVATLIQQKRYDEADAKIEIARSIQPSGAVTSFSLTLVNYEAKIFYERGLSEAHQRAAMFEEAKKIYNLSEDAEKDLPDDARVKIRNNDLGLALLALGEYPAAIEALGRKLARHKKEGNIVGVIVCLLALADAYRSAGNLGAARAVGEKAMEFARRTNRHKLLAHAYNTLASISHDEDRFDDALVEDDACLACSSVLEDPREHMQISTGIWIHKGHCYKELGRFDKALINFQAVIDNSENPVLLMSAHEGIGEVYFLAKNFEDSGRHLDLAQKNLAALPQEIAELYRFPILLLKTRLLMRKGLQKEAKNLLDEIEPLSRKSRKRLTQYLECKAEFESAAPANP